MSSRDQRHEYERWREYAREDLQVAQNGLSDPSIMPRHSCFFAQQAVEKAIKSVLILLGIEFMYSHDLEYLNTLLPVDLQMDETHFDLEGLSLWAVLSRYPGDTAVPADEDAQQAVQSAHAVMEWLETQVDSRYLED
jgi:HEPN domain-containing protein